MAYALHACMQSEALMREKERLRVSTRSTVRAGRQDALPKCTVACGRKSYAPTLRIYSKQAYGRRRPRNRGRYVKVTESSTNTSGAGVISRSGTGNLEVTPTAQRSVIHPTDVTGTHGIEPRSLIRSLTV